MTFDELLLQYPVKNPSWWTDRKNGIFSIDCSCLDKPRWLDPWNRQFNGITHPMIGTDMVDAEDVAGWRYKTTVAGETVVLFIIND